MTNLVTATNGAANNNPNDKEVLLNVEHLSKFFPIERGFFKRVVGHVRAVDDVSFRIYRGETLGLVGETGSGKTTCGLTVLRGLPATSGIVEFNFRDQGKGMVDVNQLDRDELKAYRREAQMIFQDPNSSLDPRMTVRDIIAEPLVVNKLCSGSELDDRVAHMMKVVGLDTRYLKRYPHAFSGGQRQRISLARALVMTPSFIVADEPTSALDVSIQAQILNLMMDLQEQFGLTYLFISHNLAVVKHMAHTEVTTKVEYPDQYTVKFTFAIPYGSFINHTMRESSWGAWGSFMAPAHYFKQFHTKYTDIKDILPKMDERGFKKEEEWPNFYNAIAVSTLGDSGAYYVHPYAKELPVLYPWLVQDVQEDGSATLVRNPYFYVIDTAGNQLPYLDQLKRQFISTKEQMNLDIIAGKVDVQGQFIKIDDFTLFKQNEDKGNYNVIPVRAWQHHVLIYWFNPAVTNTVEADALSQVDFRKALSLALDRNQINEAVFKGLGIPAQFAPPQGTPLYDEALSKNAAEYDPEAAKKLLDDLGYKDVNGDGFRETPDGKEFVLPILYYQVTPASDAGVQLAQTNWEAIGVKVSTKQVEGLNFWQSQGANDVAASVWWANGPDFGDGAFIGMGVNAPQWRQWYNTNGERGVQPPDWAKRIMDIQLERPKVATVEELRKLDAEGWKLLNDNLMIIGTVEGAKNPLVLSKDLGNVQYGFDKNFVSPTYWEWAFQWYYTKPERRTN